MRRVLGRSHEGVAHQKLQRALPLQERHTLRGHPTNVRNVANLVTLGAEQETVRHVVLPVQHWKRRHLQPPDLRKDKIYTPGIYIYLFDFAPGVTHTVKPIGQEKVAVCVGRIFRPWHIVRRIVQQRYRTG